MCLACKAIGLGARKVRFELENCSALLERLAGRTVGTRRSDAGDAGMDAGETGVNLGIGGHRGIAAITPTLAASSRRFASAALRRSAEICSSVGGERFAG